MKTKTEQILRMMSILAWITFIGLSIKAGALLISFGVSSVNPEATKNLYRGLNLYNLRHYSFLHFTSSVSFMVAIIVLEAYLAYLVIKVLDTIKMANPFTIEVSKILEKISYLIFVLWILATTFNGYTEWLSKSVEGLEKNTISGGTIFLAGVVFVFSQIFKKGVEIQSENELTV